MSRSTTSSLGRISNQSSCESTFSRASQKTYRTDLTSRTNTRPSIKHYPTAPTLKQLLAHEEQILDDQSFARSSTSSIDTYASTQASEEDLPCLSLDDFPRERRQCFDPDAIPSTPADFAELFPSTQRLMIQHDDSTLDGNMNLRLDIDFTSKSGRRRKMTLFHLRMHDLKERKFSLRRYWRNSGREVSSCKRKYIHDIPAGLKPNMRRSSTAPELHRRDVSRHDSGYESDNDDEDDFMEKLRAFTIAKNLKATIPTNGIQIEFSNYAQVVMEPACHDDRKQYSFEYWGKQYTWKKRPLRDGDETITSYELVNVETHQKMASMVPDALSAEETSFELSQGAWIPASSMRILQQNISDDLGDVIVATGLIALADDCIP
ncbi:hypothetical protein LTR05_008523 [Lithohypha guttulata]|uniref:Uncharacterized protein n=1 Tax=Lithohypha guttulata TaxID=1690604 RepID=A0AAN7Q7D2_9EURO|nr:hypothetical protein LTR05_008523 [Lithohypha guttulata]